MCPPRVCRLPKCSSCIPLFISSPLVSPLYSVYLLSCFPLFLICAYLRGFLIFSYFQLFMRLFCTGLSPFLLFLLSFLAADYLVFRYFLSVPLYTVSYFLSHFNSPIPLSNYPSCTGFVLFFFFFFFFCAVLTETCCNSKLTYSANVYFLSYFPLLCLTVYSFIFNSDDRKGIRKVTEVLSSKLLRKRKKYYL